MLVRRYLRIIALACAIGMGVVSCRALAYGAVHIAAHAMVALLTLAVWYSIQQPIVVYTNHGTPRVLCHLPAGAAVYVVRYSQDRRWVLVRTRDGRVGWVAAYRLEGARRM